jgi:transcription antitermination factor NusG
MKWFVACASPAKDEAVTERLREREFEVFWPFTREIKPATKKRKAYEVKHSLFPGYLFVQCELEEVWKVEDTTGVMRVICTSEGDPLPISLQIMRELQKRCDFNGEVFQRRGKSGRRRLRKGNKIRTLDEDSPLFGLVIIIQDMLDSGNICGNLQDAAQVKVQINNPHRWELVTGRSNKPGQ